MALEEYLPNIALVLVGALTGGVLGCLCGRLTHLVPVADGGVMAKANGMAAGLWVIGVGSRLVFALYVEHGGEPAIAAFSAAHDISSSAWTTCLVLMALTEVLGRTAFLAPRFARARHPIQRAPA